MIRPRLAVPLLALGTLAAPATAQRGAAISVTARVTSLTMRSVAPAARASVSGAILGGEARLAVEFLTLRVAYAQGSLAGGSDPSRDLYVEGYGILGIEPAPGLEIGIGPHVRSRIVDEVRQRLAVWRLRGRYEGAIGTPALRAWLEATAGRPDYSRDGFSTWWGGSAGLVFRPNGGVLGFGASYAIDEARANRGARRETVDGLTISVSASLR
jgi:hypothetical protein